MHKKIWIDYSKLRESLDFGTVLQHYNIEHDAGKKQVKVTCPFHDDRTPSCSISLAGEKFQCFGCGAKGNTLEFVTLMENHDPSDKRGLYQGALTAIEIMGLTPNDFKKGAEGPKSARSARKPAKAGKRPPLVKKGCTEEKQAKSEYVKPEANEVLDLSLKLDPDHPYLTEARALDPETIELFGLGYCSRGIMKGRIAIPIHNANGELVAYAGRYADDEIPDGIVRYKLPKNFHKSLELFNIHRAKSFGKRHLVVVEGYWSAIRLHQAGIPAVALMGRSVSKDQVKLILDSEFRFVTLLLDGDDEGRAAIPEALNVLGRSVYARSIELSDGQKPDSIPENILGNLK